MRIYLCPAAIDLILFLVVFAVNYAAGERRMTGWQAAWLMGAQQVAYMTFSLISGWMLTRRNARAILLTGTAATTAAAVVCFCVTGFWPLMGAMSLLGISSAFFFNAFQSFMRGEAPPGELGRAIALYTLAWSGGSAAGFLASGALYRLGPVALSALAVLVGTAVTVILLRHDQRSHDVPSVDEHTEASPHGTERSHTTYVWIAWLMIFTAVLVQRPVHTFYPKASAQAGVAPLLVSLPLFLHMLLQGVFGYGTGWLRGLLYRTGPFLAVQLAGGALLLALWFWPSFALTAVGISVLGLWTGFAYFCAVYYASNAGHRARNIGVNEFLVGLGSFLGLFICAWFMQRGDGGADCTVVYAVCGVALLGSALLQGAITLARRSAPAPSAAPGAVDG